MPGRAAFGWYGSKARLAPRIAALAAGIPHRVDVEAYDRRRSHAVRQARCVSAEIINDLDGPGRLSGHSAWVSPVFAGRQMIVASTRVPQADAAGCH
jgi:hypothetical protein